MLNDAMQIVPCIFNRSDHSGAGDGDSAAFWHEALWMAEKKPVDLPFFLWPDKATVLFSGSFLALAAFYGNQCPLCRGYAAVPSGDAASVVGGKVHGLEADADAASRFI